MRLKFPDKALVETEIRKVIRRKKGIIGFTIVSKIEVVEDILNKR